MLWNTTRVNENVTTYEEKKVNPYYGASKIRKDKNREEDGRSFREALKDKKNHTVKKKEEVKEEISNEDLIIAPSLKSLIEQNSILDRLIGEEAQNHPSLKDKMEELSYEEGENNEDK